MRSSLLDITVPKPNFWCSTWAPCENVLEAIDFLSFTPRINCGGDEVQRKREYSNGTEVPQMSLSHSSKRRATCPFATALALPRLACRGFYNHSRNGARWTKF